MYTPNWKPLVVIDPKEFKMPKCCYLASKVVTLDSAKDQYRKWKNKDKPRTVGMILDVKRLEDVARRGDCIECACPACRDIGKDTAGNNLLIRPDGRYKCAAFINLSAAENHRHNQRIYWLAGIDAKEFEHD
jgi:hypothetical protein